MENVKELVVDACCNLIEKLAEDQLVNKENLRIRIDLETLKSKPLFGLFDQSVFLERKTLREIILAAGAEAYYMILGASIKKMLRDFFSQSMKQLQVEDVQELFVLLYLKKVQGKDAPMLAVYHKKEFILSMQIDQAIKAGPQS